MRPWGGHGGCVGIVQKSQKQVRFRRVIISTVKVLAGGRGNGGGEGGGGEERAEARGGMEGGSGDGEGGHGMTERQRERERNATQVTKEECGSGYEGVTERE